MVERSVVSPRLVSPVTVAVDTSPDIACRWSRLHVIHCHRYDSHSQPPASRGYSVSVSVLHPSISIHPLIARLQT